MKKLHFVKDITGYAICGICVIKQRLKYSFYNQSNPGKRIAVLTGYYHRYYVIELQKAKINSNLELKEFYAD